ncbi:MAG TPA: hypothetical protein PKB11_15570, partial [Desulfovibrio sp.]
LSAGFFEGMLHLLFQNAIHSFWKKTRYPRNNMPVSGPVQIVKEPEKRSFTQPTEQNDRSACNMRVAAATPHRSAERQ